jgi:hydroxypyruvate isomerase
MPQFAANLSMLFTETPLLERFGRAARAGFTAVELQFPYEQPATVLREELVRHGLVMVLHNLPAGDWAAGDRGIAADPGRTEEFRRGVARAVEYATVLQVPRLNCLAGKLPAGVTAAEGRATLVANLRYAAAALQDAGLTLLIEPINRYDVPGFVVQRSDDAVALMDEVGAPNLKLQYDVYHQQRTEGELAATIERLLPRIGHIQVADNPGRHEPGTGEIAWPFLFAHLDRIGYAGHVGCEYKPAGGTEAGLRWMERFQ